MECCSHFHALGNPHRRFGMPDLVDAFPATHWICPQGSFVLIKKNYSLRPKLLDTFNNLCLKLDDLFPIFPIYIFLEI